MGRFACRGQGRSVGHRPCEAAGHDRTVQPQQAAAEDRDQRAADEDRNGREDWPESPPQRGEERGAGHVADREREQHETEGAERFGNHHPVASGHAERAQGHPQEQHRRGTQFDAAEPNASNHGARPQQQEQQQDVLASQEGESDVQ